MQMLLFDRIDEPGLNTLARLRAPRRLQRPAQGARDAAGSDRRGDLAVGHTRSRRRRLQDGPEGVVPAQGRHGQVPGLQRGRVRAGHVQGPRADAEVPAHADRGSSSPPSRPGSATPSSTSAASTCCRRTSSKPRWQRSRPPATWARTSSARSHSLKLVLQRGAGAYISAVRRPAACSTRSRPAADS